MDAESQQVEELKAEIERLRRDHQIVRNFLDAADAKLLKKEKLITGLCYALEKWEAEVVRLKQKIKEQEEYIQKLKRNAKGVTGQ